MAAPAGGDRGGRGKAGAVYCHLRGGEEGCWPANTGPAGGLRGALLGSWAKQATRGCSGSAANGADHLATCCRRLLDCHPRLGCMEEELDGT